MTTYIIREPEGSFDFNKPSAWAAVEAWMEGKTDEEMESLKGKEIVLTSSELGLRIPFVVVYRCDDWYADRTDGKEWDKKDYHSD